MNMPLSVLLGSLTASTVLGIALPADAANLQVTHLKLSRQLDQRSVNAAGQTTNEKRAKDVDDDDRIAYKWQCSNC
ncbi:hypothetical protein F5Y13DRAFT_191589 [Hypoxylon sp. FL1857]|nr:hypothetical protein F5Y13DRAFT_191589 [Hypoxylon sp. FL1857]